MQAAILGIWRFIFIVPQIDEEVNIYGRKFYVQSRSIVGVADGLEGALSEL